VLAEVAPLPVTAHETVLIEEAHVSRAWDVGTVSYQPYGSIVQSKDSL
jgi:hypothetical protein